MRGYGEKTHLISLKPYLSVEFAERQRHDLRVWRMLSAKPSIRWLANAFSWYCGGREVLEPECDFCGAREDDVLFLEGETSRLLSEANHGCNSRKVYWGKM